MLPTLRQDDLVVVLKKAKLCSGDVVVADVAPVGLVVKRISLLSDGQVTLDSDNSEAKSEVCGRALSPAVILGRVLCRLRRPFSFAFV
jgi:phage repressor protein C with HTH and peptisase S24 domain